MSAHGAPHGAAAGDGADAPPDAAAGAPADGIHPSRGIAAVLGGLVLPGLGHALIGRMVPALFVAVPVLAMHLGGMALTGWVNVDPEGSPWFFGVQCGAAGPTLLAWQLTQDITITEFHAYRSIGELFTAVAGLLNVIAVADVWARARHGDPVHRPEHELLAAAESGGDERSSATPDAAVPAAGDGARPGGARHGA